MGKAQSKRSVDITTEPKKDSGIEEGTGELKKIEEVDLKVQPVNGDTTTHINETTGEKPTETAESENEKDLSTEKELQRVTTQSNEAAAGDAPSVTEVASGSKVEENVADKSTSETLEESLNESKNGSEVADSTSKKIKKEKVKKKWSFRSISFGKKDKQKPSKKEEGPSPNTSGIAVNGECEKVPEEGTEEAVPAIETKDETVAPVEVTITAAEEAKPLPETIIEEPQPLKEEIKPVSSPVLNGISEVKEEIAAVAVEKESEKIVESVPEVKEIVTATEIPIIENKTPETVTNGEKHPDETASKMNGSVEASKTEVKNEDILYEKEQQILNIIKEHNDENIVQITNSTNEFKNLDGESALPPPPPLPSTLPPSQVMVFALSETIQEQKHESELIIPLPTDIPNIPPPVVEDDFKTNTLDDAINILKNDEIPMATISNEENPSEIISSNEKECLNFDEKKIIEDEPTNVVTKLDEIEEPKEQLVLNPIFQEVLEDEKIIEKIVDDITQGVAEQDIVAAQLAVENILKENSLTEHIDNKNQIENLPEFVENTIEVSCEDITVNQFIENCTNGNETNTENSQTDSQNDNGKITESSIDDLPSPPPTPPSYNENNTKNVDMNLINENFNKMSIENDGNKSESNNPDEDLMNAIKTGGQKQQNNQNKKENGFDENHQNNETATENLNGVDHNKIIEDIKAENQQLDKAAAEITQESAAIAAE